MQHVGAHTYSCLWFHLVWATKYRRKLITPEVKGPLIHCIRKICFDKKYHLEQINTMPDHIHLLVSLSPSQSISEAVKNIKGISWKFIRDNRLSPGFKWQIGFSAFSVSPRALHIVKRYIRNQEQHHAKVDALRELERLNQLADALVRKNCDLPTGLKPVGKTRR